MKIQPESLLANSYALLDTLDHKDIMLFIKKYIKQKTISTIFYYAFCGISLGVIGRMLLCFIFHRVLKEKMYFFMFH